MDPSRILVASAVLGALAFAPAPAQAQRAGGRMGGAVVGRAVPRASAPAMRAPRVVFAPRTIAAPRFVASRTIAAPRFVASRAIAAPRFAAPRVVAPRAFGVAPRTAFGSRGVAGNRRLAVPRVIAPRVIRPRVIGPRVNVAPFRFARPFFVFRPRFSLGLGLWAGFPVAYPYYYSYPYASPYPYGYPYPSAYPAYGYPDSPYGYPPSTYPPPGSVDVQPGQTAFGGVSFDITPNTAGVYVDGMYVGTVAEYSPTFQPLALTPGRHHVEVRAAGYQTMAFDTEIVVGQVIPYRGEMQPERH